VWHARSKSAVPILLFKEFSTMPRGIPTPESLSVPQAAAAIVALINASPRSPRPEEIEAIIARADTAPVQEAAMSSAHVALHAEWGTLVEAHVREFEGDREDGMTKAEIEAIEARVAESLEVIDCAFRRRRPVVPTHGDHLFRSMATRVA
jgi:hypothetical protein